MPKNRNAIVAHINLLLLTLFLSFAVLLTGELVTRTLFPNIHFQHSDRHLFSDRVHGSAYGLTPDTVGVSFGAIIETDKYGFRRTKIPYRAEKPSWLLLGDSVTLGMGVHRDSTLAGRMAVEIDDWNILNPSTLGYATSDYLEILKFLIDTIPIDRVTIFYCLNDIYNNKPGIPRKEPGYIWRQLFGGALDFIRSNSNLYLVLKSKISDRSRRYFEYDYQFYIDNHPAFNEAIDDLTQTVLVARSKGIDLDLVILPYEYQLRDITDTQRMLPQQAIKDGLKDIDLQIYDTADYFKQYLGEVESSKDYYLYADGIHFSAKGHALLFDAVKKELLPLKGR